MTKTRKIVRSPECSFYVEPDTVVAVEPCVKAWQVRLVTARQSVVIFTTADFREAKRIAKAVGALVESDGPGKVCIPGSHNLFGLGDALPPTQVTRLKPRGQRVNTFEDAVRAQRLERGAAR